MKKLIVAGGATCCLVLPTTGFGPTQSDMTDGTAVVSHFAPHIPIDTARDTVVPSVEGATIAYGIDTTISPCDDFYEYANGGWRKAVVFPKSWKPRQHAWSHFRASGRKTQSRMEHVIDSAHRVRNSTDNSALKVIGIFYESCLVADSLEVVLLRRKQDTTQKDSTRAQQCVQRVLRHLGGAAGQVFTEDFVSNNSVQRMNALLTSIKAAAHDQLGRNTLMSAEEIADLQKRLEKLYLRVGIPETKVDYSHLTLSPTDYNANKDAIANFNTVRFVNAIGGDAREKWKRSLFTANAFYNPAEHAIEVPPAMFLSPFFDVSADDALNFGSVGYVIAHEIFHSLARQLGQSANPTVKVEIDSFKARNSKLGTVDGWKTNGERTYTEDIADLGGIRVAYNAWKTSIARDKKAQTQIIDGFTPDQRFFLSFGQVWRAKWTSVTAGNGDVHAAYFARINGMVMQMPEFAAAFGCKAGDRMVLPPEKRSKLW